MTFGRAEDQLADRVFSHARGIVGRLPRRGPDVVYVVVLVVLFGFLAYSLRSQWFILDEFDYVQAPSGTWIAWLFTPHNEHTIVFTKLWFSTLFQLFGFRHYWLYAAPMLLAHAVAYAAVVRIVTFGSGNRRFARFATLPLVVMAAGSGTLLWGGQFQYTGAVAAGLWLLWLAIRPRRPRAWAIAVLAILGTFSGSAFIAFGVVAAMAFLVRRRVVPAIISFGIPAAWFVIERIVWSVSDAYQVKSIGQFFAGALAFVFALVDRAVVDTTRTPSFTAALCLAVIVGILMAAGRGWSRSSKIASLLAAAFAVSLLITVVGRLGRDVAGAASGGYSYFIVILAFPALLLLVYALFPARSTMAILIVAAVVLVPVDAAAYQGTASSYAQWRQGTERTLEGAAYRVLRGQAVADGLAVPDPGGSPTVTWKRLTAWAEAGKFDPRRPDSATLSQLNP